MISASHLRSTVQITLHDIFVDFDDPRKQVFHKRVQNYIEDLERRMKNQIQSNNMANLQILSKKQQHYRQLQEKYNNCVEQKEELSLSIGLHKIKIQQFDIQRNKMTNQVKIREQKIGRLTQKINKFQQQKLRFNKEVEEEKNKLFESKKQNQNLQIERQYLTQIILNLKSKHHKQLNEFTHKYEIKYHKLLQDFNQNMSSMISKVSLEKDKSAVKELKYNKKVKTQTKNQRIQTQPVLNQKFNVRFQKFQASPRLKSNRLHVKQNQLSNRSKDKQQKKNNNFELQLQPMNVNLCMIEDYQCQAAKNISKSPKRKQTQKQPGDVVPFQDEDSYQKESNSQQYISAQYIEKMDKQCQVYFQSNKNHPNKIISDNQHQQEHLKQFLQDLDRIQTKQDQKIKYIDKYNKKVSQYYWKQKYIQTNKQYQAQNEQLRVQREKNKQLQQRTKVIFNQKLRIAELQLQIQKMNNKFKKQRQILMGFNNRLTYGQIQIKKQTNPLLLQIDSKNHRNSLKSTGQHCHSEPQQIKKVIVQSRVVKNEEGSVLRNSIDQEDQLITILNSKYLFKNSQRKNAVNYRMVWKSQKIAENDKKKPYKKYSLSKKQIFNGNRTIN